VADPHSAKRAEALSAVLHEAVAFLPAVPMDLMKSLVEGRHADAVAQLVALGREREMPRRFWGKVKQAAEAMGHAPLAAFAQARRLASKVVERP
jgi:hypothetical protein